MGKAILKKSMKLNNKSERIAAIKSILKIISYIYLENEDLENSILLILMKILTIFDIYEESKSSIFKYLIAFRFNFRHSKTI